MNPALPAAASPIWVAAIALVNETGQVLMQQRPPGAVHGDLWEFPGGKLESGEAPTCAAVRELEEELGVILRSGDLKAVTFACGEAGGRPLTILLFACREWHGSPEPCAATQIGWFVPREVSRLAMPPLDYPLAEALARWLEEGAL